MRSTPEIVLTSVCMERRFQHNAGWRRANAAAARVAVNFIVEQVFFWLLMQNHCERLDVIIIMMSSASHDVPPAPRGSSVIVVIIS